MTQQPLLPKVQTLEPDERIRRLINLTARLVDKMLDTETQAQFQLRRPTDEQ
jgi:hypothetical protein